MVVIGKAGVALRDVSGSEESEEFVHCVSVLGRLGRVIQES